MIPARTPKRPLVLAMVLAMVLALGSCAPLDPKPEPLDEAAWYTAHRAGRSERFDALTDLRDRGVLDEAALAACLERGSAELAELRAVWRAAERRAHRGLALPEPRLNLGPQAAFGPDAGPSNPWGAFGSIGFSIPWGGRIDRGEELLECSADLARVRLEVRTRELGLDLRLALLRRRAVEHRADLVHGLIESAERAVETSRRAARAGSATALDVGLLELDALSARAEVLDLEQETRVIEGRLATLLGVEPSAIESLDFEFDLRRADELPGKDILVETLLSEHTDLAVLRAEYECSERALRVAVARQWPDIGLQPSFEREGGERRTLLGLQVGLQLPLFGQARRAVRDALDARSVARARFEARAQDALLELDQVMRVHDAARRRERFYRDEIEPRALAMLADVQRAAEAGSADALRWLEAQRTLRRIRLEALAAERAALEAWVAVERAVGTSLRGGPAPLVRDAVPDAEGPWIQQPGGERSPEDER